MCAPLRIDSPTTSTSSCTAAVAIISGVICLLPSLVKDLFALRLGKNLKRLWAYSSIANIGYALIGLAAGSEEGIRGVVIYMIIYLAMTLGGRAAEELVFHEVTTGAANDLEKVTEIARAMVDAHRRYRNVTDKLSLATDDRNFQGDPGGGAASKALTSTRAALT